MYSKELRTMLLALSNPLLVILEQGILPVSTKRFRLAIRNVRSSSRYDRAS